MYGHCLLSLPTSVSKAGYLHHLYANGSWGRTCMYVCMYVVCLNGIGEGTRLMIDVKLG